MSCGDREGVCTDVTSMTCGSRPAQGTARLAMVNAVKPPAREITVLIDCHVGGGGRVPGRSPPSHLEGDVA
jgi:hypothetical protein